MMLHIKKKKNNPITRVSYLNIIIKSLVNQSINRYDFNIHSSSNESPYQPIYFTSDQHFTYPRISFSEPP